MSRKRGYMPHVTTEGHYRSRVDLGRKDRAHAKLVLDTLDWLPYRIGANAASTNTVITDAREIIMNSPYAVDQLDSLGTQTFSFCGAGQVNAQANRLLYNDQTFARYGQCYERLCVTSCKLEIACRSSTPLTLDVDAKGEISDPALTGPQQLTFFGFPFPPTLASQPTQSGGALFSGNLRQAKQQPGYRQVVLSRGGAVSTGGGPHTCSLTLFSNVQKHTGKAYAEGDGGYLTNITQTGSVSSTRPSILPKFIWGFSYWNYPNVPADPGYFNFWYRMRLTYWVTFLFRRPFPNPALSITLPTYADPKVDAFETYQKSAPTPMIEELKDLIIDDNGTPLSLLSLLHV